MKLKIGMLVAGLAVAGAGFGVFGIAGTSAQETDSAEIDAPYFYGEDADLPVWLRHSIIVCAAETMQVEVDVVKAGLRNGHSLKEIGIRAGVRPEVLKNGILRCEQIVLARHVEAGDLTPDQARRVYNFLSDHITRIINYKWHPTDAATDLAPAD